MLTKIFLHGDLEQYGAERELDIATPFEAVRAISVLRPGFREEFLKGIYALVLIDRNGEAEAVDELRGNLPLSDEVIHITPVPQGEYAQAVAWLAWQITTYAGIASATGATAAYYAAAAIVAVAVSVALTGIANALWPLPKLGGTGESADNTPNNYFSGPVNTTRQGNPVPIAYGGPLLVGSQVASVSITTEELN